MPDAFDNFETALVAAIGTALPELLIGGGILRAPQAVRMALENQIEDDGLPFLVYHVVGWTDAEWGASNDCYESDVELLYVKDDPENESAVRQRLLVLKDYLRANELDAGQVLQQGRRLSTSPYASELVRAFSKQLQLAVGVLTVRCLVGVTA